MTRQFPAHELGHWFYIVVRNNGDYLFWPKRRNERKSRQTPPTFLHRIRERERAKRLTPDGENLQGTTDHAQ